MISVLPEVEVIQPFTCLSSEASIQLSRHFVSEKPEPRSFGLPVALYKGIWPSTMFIDNFVYFIHDTHGPTHGDDDLLVVRNASFGFIPSRSFGVLHFQHPLRTCRTT
jgi:hypothetical protein